MKVGYWSDGMNSVTGHELWLTPAGDMVCVTVATEWLSTVASLREVFEDLMRIGPVAERVRSFPAGTEPLVPPPARQGDGQGGNDG